MWGNLLIFLVFCYRLKQYAEEKKKNESKDEKKKKEPAKIEKKKVGFLLFYLSIEVFRAYQRFEERNGIREL